ncbi:MAG: aminotransferase class I/II-fold pyridoxal phosphate-dependent enzyme [Planctomycetaceae bacterium]|nr:aminotransferase class I/II-fold pyridoxal phosphate-dependent enzyme [Planctomycetaceae bacterium]
MLRYRCYAQPDDDAFVYLLNGIDDEATINYTELDRRARRIGAWLQERKMFGQRVLLLYPPGLDFIAAYFGCLYGGTVAVPVYPPRRNRSMLRIQAVSESANAKVALTNGVTLKRVVELIDEAPNLKELVWQATDELDDGLEDSWTMPKINSDTVAFLQYTSGSTGTPKGVVLSHSNLIHNSRLINLFFEHTRSGIGVFWLPSYHDMGLIGGILQPLFVGRPNVLMSPLAFLLKPFHWLAAITRYRGTTSGGPNFAYDLCVRQIKDEQLSELDLSSWKVAFNGAEPVSAETMKAFAKKFEPCGFRYESFYPCFGLAEGTLIVTGGMVDEPPITCCIDADQLSQGNAVDTTEDSPHARTLVSSGRNAIDQTVRIVDPDTCASCAERSVGEVWVKGPSVAQGYWDNAEATEYTFHATISDTGETPFMRTGDLGFLLNGELYITGRIKDMMIIRGVNIYPQDVEATVQKVDGVLRSLCGAAILIDDKLVIVQEVERRFKEEMAEALFTAIKKAVALEHEITVEAIVLVRHGAIPKTSSGKIQRHACRHGVVDGTLNPVVQWLSPNINLSDVQSGGVQKKDTPTVVRKNVDSSYNIDDKKMSTDSTVRNKTKPKDANVKTDGVQLTFNEAAEAVLEEVRAVGKERAANVSLETDITELGLDSLERMEILASLEDRFGGQFPETVLPELYTARQVVEAVQKYLGSGARQAATREKTAVTAIPDDWYKVEKFPEYLRLRGGLDILRSSGLNHYFDVHESVTNDRTIINGKEYINFSSYNYVNMSGDPIVTAAAQDAAAKYGTSVSASRLVSGEKPVHVALERGISEFLGTEDTIVMVGGHSTNEGVIGHLLGDGDMVLYDALAHNSIVQGALLSGARRRPFPHGDFEAADWILQKHRGEYRRVLIALEGVYSMDGDYPDLPRFIELRNRYKTLLMVDEAHSIGVLGKTGRGIGEHFAVNPADVDVWMCTLSKTFASCGGYISGKRELIEYLKYTAPGFVFSVGITPQNAAAALAALELLKREPQRVERLRENAALFLTLAKEKQLNTGVSKDSAVIPVIIGNSMKSLKLSRALFLRGINVQPILHPAVEEKAARLRFFITSAHTDKQIRYTVDCIAEELAKL